MYDRGGGIQGGPSVFCLSVCGAVQCGAKKWLLYKIPSRSREWVLVGKSTNRLRNKIRHGKGGEGAKRRSKEDKRCKNDMVDMRDAFCAYFIPDRICFSAQNPDHGTPFFVITHCQASSSRVNKLLALKEAVPVAGGKRERNDILSGPVASRLLLITSTN